METRNFGDYMRSFELMDTLPDRTYTIMRLDGRAFHTYLRKATKPFDEYFMADMAHVTTKLCENISGTVFAYTQSDEISLLLTDFEKPTTQAWFGGRIQKMTSVSAAMATAFMAKARPHHDKEYPVFDSRVFTLPNVETVVDYFRWRQRDWRRNSIMMLGQSKFSHKTLHGKNTDEIQKMLIDTYGIDWSSLDGKYRLGTMVNKFFFEVPVEYTRRDTREKVSEMAKRTVWSPHSAPDFSTEVLRDLIPVKGESDI